MRAFDLILDAPLIIFTTIANIGLARDFDYRWITQYNSLFCVTNEGGQVMTWKLTKSVAFSHIQDMLLNLKNRLDKQGKVVKEFYVDICCSWRSKLQQVFGEHLKVYLDLFHAVKRVSGTISKKHPLHYECIRALSMVFRDPQDQGQIRQMPTPSPLVMLENMKAFLQQWKDQATDGKNVLSAATILEMSRLCKHIEKGCLSGIKPGRGTNRNEALHKSLNAHFKASRYGVELAYMLLTTSFYQHNERVDAQNSKRKCRLITEYVDQLLANPVPNESFGILSAPDDDGEKESLQSPSSTLTVLSFDKASYFDIFTRLCSTTLSPDSQPGEVSIKDSIGILLRAISWFSVYDTLSKCTSTASLQCTDIPYMKADFGYSLTWTGTDMDTSEESEHLSRLSDVLASWNFQQAQVPKDGNCLFSSVALHLQSVGHDSPLHSVIESLGINLSTDSIEQIAARLRRAVVEEWLGDHFSEYTRFLTFSQLEQEAQRFSEVVSLLAMLVIWLLQL